MRLVLHISLAAVLVLAFGSFSYGQNVRLANGVSIRGEVRNVTDDGLEIQTPTGPRTYSWETLSIATRYQYQPVFRANYEAILQGLPPSARTNAPDITEEKPREVAEAPVEKTSAPTQAVAQAQSLNVFEQLEYENVDPIAISKFPNLQLRSPPLAAYVGLQYGPGKDDVAYLAFDTRTSDDPRDVVYVFSPGSPEYASTAKMGGTKVSTKEGRTATLKKFNLSSKFGQADASFDVECSFSTAQANVLMLTIGCELYKGNTKSRFVLMGQTADLVQGEGVIVVKGILDLPVLWVSLDMTTGSPRLVGNLNMSHLKLLPKEGMDNRVTVTVTDDKGAVVQRELFKLDESTAAEKYSLSCDLKKTVPGQSYTVQASIDLGPFLGPVSFEEKITIPKAQPAA
ncbi:MAG: hypothetical protein V1873_02495 [Verrucomicrobiota bacterium]